jgi:hypothetical protein
MKVLTRSKTLLLDTNLLLLLFIGGKDSSLIPKAKTLSAFVEDDYDLLGDVINNNSFNRLVTTPHIMTEVSNLLGKERDDIRRLGREAMAEFLSKCTEHTDSSVILVSEPEFNRLGLTDVAIAVASDQNRYATPVLDDDSSLKTLDRNQNPRLYQAPVK